MANFHGESSNISDINLYIQSYRQDIYPDFKKDSFLKFQSINNGVNNQSPKRPSELVTRNDQLGNLVSQLILGVSSVKPLTFYSTGGIPPSYLPDAGNPDNLNEPYMDWFHVSNYHCSKPSQTTKAPFHGIFLDS
jgi:tripeptidyl-peptidase-1